MSTPIPVLWITSGLGCDGDSIAMTSATNPTLEDLLRGSLPGVPPIVLYNPVFAFETGDDFMRVWFDAEEGKLDPFILVLEGSVPNEELSGDGHWAGMGVDRETGQPILTNSWIDRLAPRAAAVLALGTCAAYGGVPAMKNNPTGAMGLSDYLRAGWTSRLGLPVVNLPGCPVQPDNITQTLLCLVLHLARLGPPIELDAQGRPVSIFGRTVHESCNRAGFADQGEFRTSDLEMIMNKASCLSLLSNAVVLWNTLRIERIVTELRAGGTTIRDEDLVHVWPLQRRHITPNGVYFANRTMPAFVLPDPVEA